MALVETLAVFTDPNTGNEGDTFASERRAAYDGFKSALQADSCVPTNWDSDEGNRHFIELLQLVLYQEQGA